MEAEQVVLQFAAASSSSLIWARTSSQMARLLSCSAVIPAFARMGAGSLPSSLNRAHANRAIPPVAFGIVPMPSFLAWCMTKGSGPAAGVRRKNTDR